MDSTQRLMGALKFFLSADDDFLEDYKKMAQLTENAT
jgi:hypothetical protein